MQLMQLQVENNLHELMHSQSELPYTLDVLIVEPKNVEMPSLINVKSIKAYEEVEVSRIFKSTLVSQLNDNPTLSQD